MRILCPLCGFGREVDETKIPPRAQMATCPKCQHKFRFRVVDDPEPEPEQPKVPGPAGFADVQEFHDARRAAAAEVWKRLQGPLDKPLDPNGAAKPEPAQPAAEQPATPRLDADPAPTDTQAGTPADAQAAARPQSTGSPVPFEDLPRHGFFPGLWATIRAVLASPTAFFRLMPRSGGMAKPLIFHLLLAEFMVLCQYIWTWTGVGAVSQYTGSSELMDMGVHMAGSSPLLLFLFYPLLLVLRLMVMTGVVHLLLKTLKSAGGGPEATFRVLCYSAASLVCGIIPFLGPFIGGFWSIGLTILGLKEAHRTSISSALFAVLVPILLMLAMVLGLMQGAVQAG